MLTCHICVQKNLKVKIIAIIIYGHKTTVYATKMVDACGVQLAIQQGYTLSAEWREACLTYLPYLF